MVFEESCLLDVSQLLLLGSCSRAPITTRTIRYRSGTLRAVASAPVSNIAYVLGRRIRATAAEDLRPATVAVAAAQRYKGKLLRLLRCYPNARPQQQARDKLHVVSNSDVKMLIATPRDKH
jgi:hypothetical protein